MKWIVGLLIPTITLLLNCNSQNSIPIKVEHLSQKGRSDSPSVYSEFRKIGKDAIPHLINVIDKNEEGFVGFSDSFSSTRYPDFNFIGMRAAYMVEYILADTGNIRIYENAVIVPTKGNSIESRRLSLEEMRLIKRIYGEWWENNKHKTLSQLKNDWVKGYRPLRNSMFAWK